MLIKEKNNEAGTDHPFFYDIRTDVEYRGDWDDGDGFPFGYWPIDANGTKKMFVGREMEWHNELCIAAAKEYFDSVIQVEMNNCISNVEGLFDELISDIKQYGYKYDYEDDEYVSADGTDSFTIEEKANDLWNILNNACGINTIDSSVMENYVQFIMDNDEMPNMKDVEWDAWRVIEEMYPFDDKESTSFALEFICGMNFDNFFEDGMYEGRVWPWEKLISFYTTEQPEPQAVYDILNDLSEAASDRLPSVEDLMNYIIIFEDWRYSDGDVTACTVSEYVSGSYYAYDGNDEDDEGDNVQYARQGKTQFIPHLASQDEKRQFFQDFRNTRDQAKYVPRERGAKTLAAYHAMRYPYGESHNRIGAIIREEINRLLK